MVTFVLSSSPSRLPYKIGRLRDYLASRISPALRPAKEKGWRSTRWPARQISRSISCSAAMVRCYRSLDRRLGFRLSRRAKRLRGIALDQRDRRVRQNPHQRAEHVAAKIDREPMKSCASCGHCATRICFGKITTRSAPVNGKLLKLRSHGPTWCRRMDFRGNISSKRKNHQAATGRRLDVCRKSPTVIIKSKDQTPKVILTCRVKFGSVSPVSHADHPRELPLHFFPLINRDTRGNDDDLS